MIMVTVMAVIQAENMGESKMRRRSRGGGDTINKYSMEA